MAVNTTYKKNRKIEWIVIHYTAGTSSSGKSDENVAAWFSRSETKASSDFIVDDDSVTQFNLDIPNNYTWHCGGSKYNTKGGTLHGKVTNANSIGIEICSSNRTGKVTSANDPSWYFTDAAISNAIGLVKSLMIEYKIDIDHVVRHYDVNGKLCPGIVGWNDDSGNSDLWKDFITRLFREVTVEDSKEVHPCERIAVFAGSFDPFTFGHLDIVERAARIFDRLYVVVSSNPLKSYTLPSSVRADLIQKSIKGFKNVEVVSHEGLVIDFMKSIGSKFLVRGVRNGTDFSVEQTLSWNNGNLYPDCETVLLSSKPDHMAISSTSVREMVKFGVDREILSKYVPGAVLEFILK